MLLLRLGPLFAEELRVEIVVKARRVSKVKVRRCSCGRTIACV